MTFFSETLLVGVAETPELAAVFDESLMLQRWLDVEAALAAAEADVELIPRAAAEAIRKHARIEEIDRAALAVEQTRVNHPLVPLLRQLVSVCGEWGAYVHWGATTQDIVDCGLVLQLRDAWPILERDLKVVTRTLCDLSRRHRGTVMAGRTHAQHALPITFGFKVSVWIAECVRHLQRLRQMKERVLVGQLAGAVGTMAGFGPQAFAIQERVMRLLKLRTPLVGWHTARDGLLELVCWCASLGATLGKIGNEIVTLQRTEVGEAEEPFGEANVGSSTMPHKRNPFASEKVVSIAELLRELPSSMLGAMRHLHERDNGPWSVELATVPRAVCLCGAALHTMKHVLGGLSVYPERMAANLTQSSGLIASESVMLELARSIGREHAHHVVHEAAMRAHKEGKSFRDALTGDPRITAHLSAEKLDQALDPATYVGLSAEIVDRVVIYAEREIESSAAA